MRRIEGRLAGREASGGFHVWRRVERGGMSPGKPDGPPVPSAEGFPLFLRTS